MVGRVGRRVPGIFWLYSSVVFGAIVSAGLPQESPRCVGEVSDCLCGGSVRSETDHTVHSMLKVKGQQGPSAHWLQTEVMWTSQLAGTLPPDRQKSAT